jgi:hypothetical protein
MARQWSCALKIWGVRNWRLMASIVSEHGRPIVEQAELDRMAMAKDITDGAA